jgi:anti-anti-sigma factor
MLFTVYTRGIKANFYSPTYVSFFGQRSGGKMLQFSTQRSGDKVVLQCAGRMVAGEGLKGLQKTATAQRAAVLVMDLQAVEALDAAGLGTLLRIRQWCIAQGTGLKLINLKRHVREVLAVTALDSVIEIHPTEAAGESGGLPREWACVES